MCSRGVLFAKRPSVSSLLSVFLTKTPIIQFYCTTVGHYYNTAKNLFCPMKHDFYDAFLIKTKVVLFFSKLMILNQFWEHKFQEKKQGHNLGFH